MLVGAGERARSTLIPAIHASAQTVELVAVCTRSERPVELLGGRFRTTTRLLPDVDLDGIDAAIVSVGTRSVPSVLDELAGRGEPRITALVDTPVLDPSDLAAARGFGRFGSVLASEDNYTLPFYVQARRLLDEGTLGRLRKAYLFHSGYRHHALAALKRLSGARARRVSIDRSTPWSAEVHVTFPGGLRALIVEPRRYEIGRTLVVGDAAFVADYPIDHPKAIRIGYRTVGDRFRGLTVDGEAVENDRDEAFAAALEGAPLEDPSLMNQMKIRGFMDLLAALGDPTSPDRYPAVDAIDDNLTMHVAERLHVSPARGPVLRSAARLAASFARSAGERP